jgi:hypothetical protein
VTPTIDRQDLLSAFHDLGERAYALGKTVEISVYGGSALLLTYDWRHPTRDLDAVFEHDKTLVRQLAAEIAADRGWDSNWLNDGVKGFLSQIDGATGSKQLFGTFPSEERPGLRVLVAAPAYLFAMKCRAMRLGGIDASPDLEDIRQLAISLNIKTAAQAIDIVSSFYPRRVIEAKTQFGIEEIFAGLSKQTGEQE